jgi:hypothetical protein
MGNADALRSTVLEWTRIVRKRLKIGPADSEELARRIKKINLYGWNVIEISPKVFVETYLLIDWGNSFARDGTIETRYGYCFGMRDHFSILYSGDLVLCCMDFDGQTSIGNLGQLSLVQILNSPDLERIVKGFKRGRLVHPYCRRCLGSHSRLGAFVKPTASILGLKVLKRFLYRRYKLFD